jgi:hypothetical protein
MRIIDQRKMIQDLKDYASKMDRRERDEFEMFEKRSKDDEELDNLAFTRLQEMHKRYVAKKTKADIEAMLKKYSTGLNKDKKGQ